MFPLDPQELARGFREFLIKFSPHQAGRDITAVVGLVAIAFLVSKPDAVNISCEPKW